MGVQRLTGIPDGGGGGAHIVSRIKLGSSNMQKEYTPLSPELSSLNKTKN